MLNCWCSVVECLLDYWMLVLPSLLDTLELLAYFHGPANVLLLRSEGYVNLLAVVIGETIQESLVVLHLLGWRMVANLDIVLIDESNDLAVVSLERYSVFPFVGVRVGLPAVPEFRVFESIFQFFLELDPVGVFMYATLPYGMG